MPLPVENPHVTERGRAVAGLLGSFWLEVHEDAPLFRRYAAGVGELLAEQLAGHQAARDSLGRRSIQPGRRLSWRPLTVSEKSMRLASAGRLRYGDTARFGHHHPGSLESGGVIGSQEDSVIIGSGSTVISGNSGGARGILYSYGDRDELAARAVEIDPAWLHVAMLTDGLRESGLMLTGDTDFRIEPDPDPFSSSRMLIFRINPFDLPGVTIREVEDPTTGETDRVMNLWAWSITADPRKTESNFGVALHLRGSDTPGFKRAVNAAYDTLAPGPSEGVIRELLAALADLPLSRSRERVQDVHTLEDGRTVITTPEHAYTLPEHCNPTASRDQMLQPAQSLGDGLRFLSFSSLIHTLGGWQLHHPEAGPIAFPDNPDLKPIKRPDGRVELPTHGTPRAVRRFWTSVHRRAAEYDTSVREMISDEGNLPATYNPADFVRAELGNRPFAALLRPVGFGPDRQEALGRLLKQSLPAGRRAAIVAEIESQSEAYFGFAATERRAGAESEPDTLGVGGPGVESAYPALDSPEAIVSPVSVIQTEDGFDLESEDGSLLVTEGSEISDGGMATDGPWLSLTATECV